MESVDLLHGQLARVGAQQNMLDVLGRKSADGVKASPYAARAPLITLPRSWNRRHRAACFHRFHIGLDIAYVENELFAVLEAQFSEPLSPSMAEEEVGPPTCTTARR